MQRLMKWMHPRPLNRVGIREYYAINGKLTHNKMKFPPEMIWYFGVDKLERALGAAGYGPGLAKLKDALAAAAYGCKKRRRRRRGRKKRL